MFSQDGTVIPSNDEECRQNRIRRIILEQKENVKKMEERREARLKRLHDFGRVNELIFTKEGVYGIDERRRPLHSDFEQNNSMVEHRNLKANMKRQFRVEKVW